MNNNSPLLKYYQNNLISKEYTKSKKLILHSSNNIDYRYEVIDKLGTGTFSNVYKCYDHKENKQKALKVIKNNVHYHRAALREASIYDLIMKESKICDNIIKLNRYFKFNGDIFFDFELGGISLYEYYNEKLNIIDINNFSRQILYGLIFIHKLNIIHSDLKPENIIIKNNKLKIIDFGSSFVENTDLHNSYIQSRWYRSPEILYKHQITTKIDMWSYGCIIYEVYNKKPLLPAKNNTQLIYMIQKMLNNDKQFLFIKDNIELNNIIKKCMVFNYKKRCSSGELITDEYFCVNL